MLNSVQLQCSLRVCPGFPFLKKKKRRSTGTPGPFLTPQHAHTHGPQLWSCDPNLLATRACPSAASPTTYPLKPVSLTHTLKISTAAQEIFGLVASARCRSYVFMPVCSFYPSVSKSLIDVFIHNTHTLRGGGWSRPNAARCPCQKP